MSIAELREIAETAIIERAHHVEIMEAVDAYALAVHVEACREALHHDVDKPAVRACGDGWYCEQAEALKA